MYKTESERGAGARLNIKFTPRLAAQERCYDIISQLQAFCKVIPPVFPGGYSGYCAA